MQKIIEIAPNDLCLVKAKIAKANKKAAALGVAPVAIESTTTFVKTTKTRNNEVEYHQMLRVELSYEPLKFGDYTFVATLDHTVGQNPIVNAVPEQIVPEQYFTTASRCDHCSTARFRKQTYLFKDAEGYKLVGRSCLKDFFGVNPVKNIDWFYSIANLDQDQEGGLSSRGERMVPVSYAVALGLALTKRYGYVSSKQAAAYAEKSNYENSIQTTAQRASSTLFVDLIQPTPEEVQYRRDLLAEADALVEQAQELIKWGVERFSTQNSSYAHNLRVLLATDFVSSRYIGYVVSIISAYNRELELNTVQNAPKSNEFVGVVGDKLVAEVTVLKHNSFETDYGVTHLFNMADAAGNTLVWFASNNALTVGDTITLKGTIKAHNERNGRNQTVLTRCKVQ